MMWGPFCQWIAHAAWTPRGMAALAWLIITIPVLCQIRRLIPADSARHRRAAGGTRKIAPARPLVDHDGTTWRTLPERVR